MVKIQGPSQGEERRGLLIIYNIVVNSWPSPHALHVVISLSILSLALRSTLPSPCSSKELTAVNFLLTRWRHAATTTFSTFICTIFAVRGTQQEVEKLYCYAVAIQPRGTVPRLALSFFWRPHRLCDRRHNSLLILCTAKKETQQRAFLSDSMIPISWYDHIYYLCFLKAPLQLILLRGRYPRGHPRYIFLQLDKPVSTDSESTDTIPEVSFYIVLLIQC